MKMGISITVPKELLDRLDIIVEKTMVKRSNLITKAIEQYLENFKNNKGE